MFSEEMRKLLIQVVCSWQVLAVTVVLILYVFLVNFVARVYRRSSRSRRMFIPSPKPDAPEPKASAPVHSDSDELDLEEDARPGRK